MSSDYVELRRLNVGIGEAGRTTGHVVRREAPRAKGNQPPPVESATRREALRYQRWRPRQKRREAAKSVVKRLVVSRVLLGNTRPSR
jgi:hypothetical protein